MITKSDTNAAMKKTQLHKDDVGSPQTQAAVLTARIKEITAHLQGNKHDHMARRGLIQMVGKRKRLLKYVERKDFEGYRKLVATLGLRK